MPTVVLLLTPPTFSSSRKLANIFVVTTDETKNQKHVCSLQHMLEEADARSMTAIEGRRKMQMTHTQSRHRIYYLENRTKYLQEQLDTLKSKHSSMLTSYWVVQAGLSDPKTSQRSVEALCEDNINNHHHIKQTPHIQTCSMSPIGICDRHR